MATQQIDYNLSQSDAQVNVVDNAMAVTLAGTGGTTSILDGGAGFIPYGNMQILTVDNTASGVGFSAFPSGTSHVMVITETAEARFAFDGYTVVSSTVGIPLAAGEERVWPVAFVTPMKMIRTGATSAKWYGQPLKRV